MAYLEYLVHHPRPARAGAPTIDAWRVTEPAAAARAPRPDRTPDLPSATHFVGWVVLGAIAVLLATVLLAAGVALLGALLGTSLLALAAVNVRGGPSGAAGATGRLRRRRPSQARPTRGRRSVADTCYNDYH